MLDELKTVDDMREWLACGILGLIDIADPLEKTTTTLIV
jgi:hypothetical protein